jgi:predicted NBD/HSP70 family sugar kinase
MTLAEHWFGDGRDIDNFAVLTIGAGVGYGLVTHRRLVTSPDAGVVSSVISRWRPKAPGALTATAAAQTRCSASAGCDPRPPWR